MGKKSGNKNTTRSDDTFDISSDSELLRTFIQKNTPAPSPKLHLNPPKFNLTQWEDNRAYHPTPALNRPASAVQRGNARLVIPAAKNPKASPRASLPSQIGFQAPKGVLLCVRRKQRREVLFAKRLRAKGAHSRKHRTRWSDVKC